MAGIPRRPDFKCLFVAPHGTVAEVEEEVSKIHGRGRESHFLNAQSLEGR
jgi:hypothetical protein